MYDVVDSQRVAEAIERRRKVPVPDKFPASLDDFLKLIVRGKTSADSTKRLRDYLDERYRDHKDNPQVHVTTIAEIKKGDKTGGFFNADLWRLHGTNYLQWWQNQKSSKASDSARRRKEKKSFWQLTSAVLRMQVNTLSDAVGYIAISPLEGKRRFVVVPDVAHDLPAEVGLGVEDAA